MLEEIVSKIREIIDEHLYVDIPSSDINEEDGLQSKVGLDSLEFTELRFQCEKAFNIYISDEDYVPENFSNIKKLSSLIYRLKNKGN